YALDYLASAKNQLRFRFHQSQEKGLMLATALAMHLIKSKRADRENYLEALEKVDASDLRTAAGKYLAGGKYVVVSVIPLKKTTGK
ncbi:MAG: peptidase M16, partial [Candidatus Aminicenantales bacterium]